MIQDMTIHLYGRRRLVTNEIISEESIINSSSFSPSHPRRFGTWSKLILFHHMAGARLLGIEALVQELLVHFFSDFLASQLFSKNV